MKKIIFIMLAAAVTLLVFLFIFVIKDKIEQKNIIDAYSFSSLEKHDIEQVVVADGAVVGLQEVDLKFRTGGIIEEINYSIGAEVKRGNLLAKLDSDDQEIAVRQHEASLSQARANLNLKLAGADNEDIAVYQSKIDNAKKNLKSTIASTEEDIKNSEARLSSAQVVLDEATTNKKTVEEQNALDARVAYEGAQSTVSASLLTAEKTLDDVNDFWEDEDLDDLFSIKNSQYKFESENDYNQAKSLYDSLSAAVGAANDHNYAEIDSLLSQTKDSLESVRDFLDSVFNGLVSTVTSSGLTQADLEAYKNQINNLRSGVDGAIVSIENKEQAIAQIATKSAANMSSVNAAISKAEASLELEKTNLDSIKAKANSQLVHAENSLKLADDEHALKISTPREVDIAYLQAKVYEASASLDLAKENLKKTMILSPVDGKVSDIKADVGESIGSQDVFIRLVSSEKKIETNIPEIEIGKVSLDDEVKIILDAFAGKVFAGKVISIDPAETNIQGVIYYKADIIFDDSADKDLVFVGMTADVNILTDRKEDVFCLPKSSVKEKDGKPYVQILEDGKIKERDIVVGMEANGNMEIISGISEADKIINPISI